MTSSGLPRKPKNRASAAKGQSASGSPTRSSSVPRAGKKVQMKARVVADSAPSDLEHSRSQSLGHGLPGPLQSDLSANLQISPNEVELFVQGIALGSLRRRPVLILKDRTGHWTLPVWLNPVDASHALEDFSHNAADAHAVTVKLMENFGLRLDRCVFEELKGHHQFVTLHFSERASGHLPEGRLAERSSDGNKGMAMQVRADSAMSLCLAVGARFFASSAFIESCRDVDAEIMDVERGSNSRAEMNAKNHRYLM